MKWFKHKDRKEKQSPETASPVVIQHKVEAPVDDKYAHLGKRDEKLTLNYYHSNCLRIMIAKYNQEFGGVEEKIYLNDQKDQIRRILG